MRWLEVWTDEDGYLLVVKATTAGAFEVFDPQTQKVDSTHSSYDDVVNDLREDEFSRVEGRHDVG
jgi:hypothetical protein